MARLITELAAATTPLAGTELAWIEIAGVPKKVAVSEFGGGATSSLRASWNFDTAIDATDPGANDFKFDSGTLASVTNIYVNDSMVGGSDASTMIGFLQTNDLIWIEQADTVTKVALFKLSGAPTDNTGWWTIPVTVEHSATLMDSAAECRWSFEFQSAGAAASQLSDLSDVVSATNTNLFALMANGTTGYVGRALVAADVSDFDTEVSNNSAVSANTAKTSNVTHTGEVTGSTSLSLANSAITGQTALTSGLSGTDELMVSDAGTLKRMDVSVMNAYFNANLSFAASSHSHTGTTISALDTADTTTGTFADARISSASVTQHLGDYANWTTSGQNDGQMTIGTAAATGGANGDIHFRY